MRVQIATVLLLAALLEQCCHALPKVLPKVAAMSFAHGLAPSPFNFREVYLLESRIEERRQDRSFDPNHSEETQSRTYYGQANPFAQQFMDRRSDWKTYQGAGWTEYVKQTDGYRQMGGFQLAEKQYLEMLALLRKAQGSDASDVSLLLDHLAEFYLEERDFEKAYDYFTQAVQVRRASLNTYTCPKVVQGNSPPLMALRNCRLHLSDLLTRLAELDLGHGDVKSADAKLTEAVAIVNETENLRYAEGLYAIYFQSISLERQSRWREAEMLWSTSIKLRDSFSNTASYWDAQREMAAFYARHGDFHAGAAIVMRIEASDAAKTALPQGHAQPLDNRPHSFTYDRYRALSDIAMSEILALDAWQTAGVEKALLLLKDTSDSRNDSLLLRASDAEQTELLAWFAKRANLHMSILLDGRPTQAHVDKAYLLLSQVKGSYLTTNAEVSRLVQSYRGNPNISGPELAIRDQLAVARTVQARLFVSSALDHKPYDPVQFIANDNKLRILSTALLAESANSIHSYFAIPELTKSIPTAAAFLDFATWQKTMRDGRSETEYCVFAVRSDNPVRFIDLGPAGPIDSDIQALHPTRKPGSQQRSMEVGGKQAMPPVPVDWSRLAALYQKVLAPVEGILHGVTDLYVAPDGKLAMAPFSALQARNRYVVENRSVMYVGSWREIMRASSDDSKLASPPVVVANPDFNLDLAKLSDAPVQRFGGLMPLPEALNEASDVAKRLEISGERVLTGPAARKQLVQSLQSPRILHLATHSMADLGWTPPAPEYQMFEFPQPLNTQFPLLQSMIAFAGANRPQEGVEDGLMTALEASSLDLTETNLVVLSSCESGRGSTLDGQGVLGLRAAFSMAGASAMIMTLWPVDDAAGRQLMNFFYGHLVADTSNPARALRLAQMDMQKDARYADPFFWAGYLASGHAMLETANKGNVTVRQTLDPEGGQIFTTPNCFEILAHTLTGQDLRSTFIRVTIGGVVRRSQNSPHEATYSLQDPGNQVEVRTRVTVNGTLIDGSEEDVVASERDWAEDVIVEKQTTFSSVSFRFGPRRAEPTQRRRITLKGAPNLFPNLDIPSKLPPRSAYLELTDSRKEQIDEVNFCKVLVK